MVVKQFEGILKNILLISANAIAGAIILAAMDGKVHGITDILKLWDHFALLALVQVCTWIKSRSPVSPAAVAEKNTPPVDPQPLPFKVLDNE